MNKNCVKSRFLKLIISYGVLEEFASVLDQLWAVFYYLPILTTTKWTMDSGQQQNGTKLAYISNGTSNKNCLKEVPKHLHDSTKNTFNTKIGNPWKIRSHSFFFTCEVISWFLHSLSLAIIKAFSLTLGYSDP